MRGPWEEVITLHEPWAPNLLLHLSQHPYPLDLTQRVQNRNRFRWRLSPLTY